MAMQGYAFNFLKTFQEFVPSQTAGDWSLSKTQKKIAEMTMKSQ